MGKLEIKNLTKRYGEKVALNNFSMTVNEGEIVGLIGRNGAGKTTLLDSIAGNIYVTSGEIYYNNSDLLKDTTQRKDFGILITASFLDYLNTYENLELLMNAYGDSNKEYINKRIDEVLTIVGLEKHKKKYVKSFSFGMKQRLGFAQALLNGKQMLILDEPFVGLDIHGREIVKNYVKKFVKESNIGVIFSDHNLDEVKDLCSRVVCIKDGIKIYDGEPEENAKYKIFVDDLKDELVNDLIKYKKIEIDMTQKVISFSENKLININDILTSIIKKQINILKISTIENSLEILLKE